MRKLIAVVGILLVAGGGVFVFFQRDTVLGFFKKGVRQAKGLTPAKTPQEAVDKFREAVQKQDYESAALYLGGDYAEQMQRGAKSANELGSEIDNLRAQIKNHKKTSDRAEFALRMLEPFPSNFEVPTITKKSDTEHHAVFFDKSWAGLQVEQRYDFWKVDPLVPHVFYRYPVQAPVVFKLEGTGDEKSWKMYFPMNPEIRASVERLNAKSGDYVNALKKVKYDVEHEPGTGKDVETKLKTELEALAR